MTHDFSGTAGKGGSSDLIPHAQLALATISYRGLKISKDPNPETGQQGRYLDIELTINEGQPFGRRKIWTKIMDPSWPGNSAKAKEMGSNAIGRILECGRHGARPGFVFQQFHQQGGYVVRDPEFRDLDGLVVGIKIKIDKGTNGHQDKNDVADYLSPNPASESFKTLERLMRGEFNRAGTQPGAPAGGGTFGAAPQQQPNLFGQQPAGAAPAPGGGWGQQPAQPQPQQPPQGYQPPPQQAPQGQQWGGAPQGQQWGGAPAGNPPFGSTSPAPAAAATHPGAGPSPGASPDPGSAMKSPSDQGGGNPNSWLHQANR